MNAFRFEGPRCSLQLKYHLQAVVVVMLLGSIASHNRRLKLINEFSQRCCSAQRSASLRRGTAITHRLVRKQVVVDRLRCDVELQRLIRPVIGLCHV